MTDHNDWSWWTNALAGNRGELTRGDPKSGFYRSHNKACAIWRDETGALFASVSEGFCPRQPDEIDEAFGFWSQRPITYEVFETFMQTGKWPNSIETPAIEHAPETPEHDRVKAEVKAILTEAAAWFNGLPDGISTDDEDAKAANYAKALADLKSKAEDTRTAQKKPHLEAGRAIDAAWKPVVEAADEARKRVLAPTVTYRQKRADEEEAKRQADLRRQAEEASKVEEAGERAAPIVAAPKRATGLHAVKVVEITDRLALATYIANLNTEQPDFDEVLRKLARRLIERGVEVPGAKLKTEMRAR